MIETKLHEKQNFPALCDANCNREEPVQKPSGLFPWRSGYQPKRSFFPRTRFRIPCSVRLSGIPRTDTDKTDMVRLSVCPTDVPKIQLARSSNEGLQEEYFQHAPNSEESVGGTSDGLDVPVEHPHELHPCAHSCCQRNRHQLVWLLCGLTAVVLVVWWWRSCFCSGSRRRISWRRLGVLVWETWQSPASQPRSSTALTGGDNCWRGAPEFPLKLSRALAACPGSSAGEVGRSLFCLVVVCVLAPSFSSSHHEARRKKEKQKLNNKTGWLLHDVGRPITVGRPPNQRRCAIENFPHHQQ